MSEDEHSKDAFELWLAANLETVDPEKMIFSPTITTKVEQLKEKEILRRAVLQERLYGAVFIIALAAGTGLLFCQPILHLTYDTVSTKLMGLIDSIGDGNSFGLIMSLSFVGICILTQRVWDMISEM